MNLPEETWLKMVILLAVVLVSWSIPLLIFTLIRHRRGKDIRSVWTKYISWFIMFPAFIVPMLLGVTVMQAFFLVLSLFAFEEFSRAVGLWRERVHMWLGRFCIFLVYIAVFTKGFGLFMSMPAYVILLTFLIPIFRDQFSAMIQKTCLTIIGVIYFGWFLAHLAFLLNASTGRELVLAMMLIVVTNDAVAYIIGSTFGKRRMVPNLSPNKTWEGAIGAMIVTIGVTMGLRFALYDMTVLIAALFGLLLAFGGTCGDLVISVIKRDVQIKDTGNLIPGHGGLLDRLDSVLFVSPIFFHFMNAFYIHEVVS
ncbi:MAG: phosphatidate cytidylyltransferase [Dehalococcoidales bacterium]|nr:phosphatidate cytidylyltransferase [Dehalococcoidales bacterium]